MTLPDPSTASRVGATLIERVKSWSSLSRLGMGAAVAALLGVAVFFTLGIAGAGGGQDGAIQETAPVVETPRELVRRVLPAPTASPPPPSPSPIAAPARPPGSSPSASFRRSAIDRITIPRFSVDAPIVVLGVDGDGVMETPDDPTVVAWYDFSARPGYSVEEDGGNAVFSGHVDYYNYGPAVFWNLRYLELGDEIDIRLTDGTLIRYSVISNDQYNAATAPIREIVGDTLSEVVTLITCGGTFDPSIGEYDDRIIVRAQRIF